MHITVEAWPLKNVIALQAVASSSQLLPRKDIKHTGLCCMHQTTHQDATECVQGNNCISHFAFSRTSGLLFKRCQVGPALAHMFSDVSC